MLRYFPTFDPFNSSMDELRRRMDRMFEEVAISRALPVQNTGFPRVNLFDAGEALVIEADLPGVADKQVQLDVQAELVTLAGQRESQAPEGATVHRRERPSVQFTRSFALPCKIDPEKATASLKDGVLTVSLPKAPDSKPRTIAIQTTG